MPLKTFLYLKIILFVFIFNISSAQKVTIPSPKYPELFKSIPTIESNTPEWAKLMYSSEPNVRKIETAYALYYKEHPYQKNTHIQNYKHFMRIVFSENYVQKDGSLLAPVKTAMHKRSPNKFQKHFAELRSTATANWKFIGPFETYQRDGVTKIDSQVNVFCIDQSQSNPNTLIAGTETGAVFISTDKGDTWHDTADELGVGRGISAVAIDPSDDKILYFAQGNSFFKSTDKGGTWSEIHSLDFLLLTDISINPNNGNDILTAGDSGLFRSTDGGSSWSRIISDKCWDIERKTNDSNTVYVAKSNATSNITEIWKSLDNGLNFSPRTTGWFTPTNFRAATNSGARLAVTEADPNRLYVLLLGTDISYNDDVNFLGVYRSDDAGESWILPYDGNNDGVMDNDPGGPYSNTDWCLSCFGFSDTLTGGGNYDQGFYNASIDVSDEDPDLLLVGMLNLFQSSNGAGNFSAWGGYICNGDCPENKQHPDIQEIKINGNDVWVASDGGINLYNKNFIFQDVKIKGMNATENWGFGQGWNEDLIIGGRYHNGNGVYRPSFTDGKFIYAGGGEEATGYVSADSRVSRFSDIPDLIVPQQLGDPFQYSEVNLNMYPNESYYDLKKRSEIVNHPVYNNVHYLGKDNNLWKTTDSGASYTLVKSFGNNDLDVLQSIEIPRDDPNFIYVSQLLDISERGSIVWKSTDGGATWTKIRTSLNIENQRVILQVAEDDKNEVYLAYGNSDNSNKKVFKSLDGGNTWTNITTNTLDKLIQHLIIQNGTDGGVYAVTDTNVYYRNNTMTDWTPYGDGLPTRKRFNKLLPFYRDGKMRGATYNRGYVETPLYERFKPIAQPLANSEFKYCTKDTIYFDDYSILNHAGATWQWDFPGASYVSSNTARNPKVVYETKGNYDVTLTVTDGNMNTDTKTIREMIKFQEDLCQTSSLDNNALNMERTGNNYASITDIDLDNLSNFTVSAWIKPDTSIQKDYASIFTAISDDGSVCGINFRENNELGMHWEGDQWWWSTGLYVPTDQWSYIAMVVTPTNVTLYLNEQKAVRTFNTGIANLGNARIGSYVGRIDRNYDGLIEEIAIWDKSLTEKEIRKNRHLFKDTSAPNLKAYYQCNTIISGKIFDLINLKHMSVLGNVTLQNSTAPVASGVSQKLSITATGEYNFDVPGVSLNFNSGTTPNGDVYISKLNALPHSSNFETVTNNSYWIINNYGTNKTFTGLNNIAFNALGDLSTATASDFSLFNRPSNDDTLSGWGTSITATPAIDYGKEKLDFVSTSINSFGQFVMNYEGGSTLNLPSLEIKPKEFPKALMKNKQLSFDHLTANKYHISIYSISGKEVIKHTVLDNHIDMSPFANGVYFYWIETESNLFSGKFISK